MNNRGYPSGFPRNECEVMWLLATNMDKLGWSKIMSIHTQFPDMKVETANGTTERVEVEYTTRGLISHYLVFLRFDNLSPPGTWKEAENGVIVNFSPTISNVIKKFRNTTRTEKSQNHELMRQFFNVYGEEPNAFLERGIDFPAEVIEDGEEETLFLPNRRFLAVTNYRKTYKVFNGELYYTSVPGEVDHYVAWKDDPRFRQFCEDTVPVTILSEMDVEWN